MKKHFIALMLCAMMLALSAVPAAASFDVRDYLEDEWTWFGYTYGGVTFAVPADCVMYDISPEQEAAGLLMLYGNNDIMIQLRRYDIKDRTYDEYREVMDSNVEAGGSSVTVFTTDDGSDIVCYRNLRPSANVQLAAVALEGLDGALYVIGIFTGDSEAYDDDAPVWALIEKIAASAHREDFSNWPIGQDQPAQADGAE